MAAISWMNQRSWMNQQSWLRRSVCFALLIVCCSLSAVYGQDGHSFLETQTRFIQRLRWTQGQNITRYEVTVERGENNAYTRVHQEFTTETFIEVSLPPGDYRYRIIPYDLFDRPGQASGWMSFQIIPALAPELRSFSPESFVMAITRDEYVLEINAANLEQGVNINLRRPGNDGDILEIDPVETIVSPDGTGAVLYFSADRLQPGIYVLHARNPSGLETSHWISFQITAALAPELHGFSPESFLLAPDQNEYVLEITASKLEQGADIYLRRPGSSDDINAGDPVETIISPDGTSAKLYFRPNQLAPGLYILHARNPGGYETSLGGFSIEQKPDNPVDFIIEPDLSQHSSLDFYLSPLWLPLFYLHGDDPAPAGTLLHPEGVGLRFGALTANSSPVNMGFELSASWYTFTDETVRSLLLENNLLLRGRLGGNAALIFRLGTGLILPFAGEEESFLNTRAIFANAGLSFYWLPVKNIIVEAGAHYSYSFELDNHSGFLRPFIGIGFIRRGND